MSDVKDDGEALFAAARQLVRALDELNTGTMLAAAAWSQLPTVFQAESTTPVLVPLMTPAVRMAAELCGAAEQFASIAARAADELETLKAEHDRLVRQIAELHADALGKAAAHLARQAATGNVVAAVAAAALSWRDIPALVADEAELRRRVAAHNDNVEATIAAIARQIDSISITPVKLDPIRTAAAVVTVRTSLSYSQLQKASPATLLAWLESTDPAEIAEMLAAHPELADEFWNNSPDANSVASWWAGLSPADKKKLSSDAAAIIGNLGGIPYSVRDAANRQQLKAAQAEASKREKSQKQALAGIPQRIVTAGGTIDNPAYTAAAAALAATRTQLAAYKDIADALKTLPGGGARSLVDFNPDQVPPLAAVGIGDLDAAQKITYAVPGMGNELGADKDVMTNWTSAAQNLYNEENSSTVDPGHTHAVIAAISYTSPELMDEPLTADAHAGAARVASELDAITATRGTAGSPVQVTALGHSYGTTVLSDALTRTTTSVHDVVLLGSAGLEHQPDTFHVDTTDGQPNVYATHAKADDLAKVGYTTGTGHDINPGDPAAEPYSTHGRATTRGGITAEGDTIFSSDGGTFDGTRYLATDGHSALGHTGPLTAGDRVEIALGYQASAGHGYLDPHTESLHNAAAAAAGVPEKIVGPTIVQAPQ